MLKSFYTELNNHEKVNMPDLENIIKTLSMKESFEDSEFEKSPPIIVIHCEFSQKRGPKLYRYLRKRDREINEDNYPNLIYPNIYLLKGGYSQFVKSCPVIKYLFKS